MSGTYYITQVYLGYWPITRPKRTVDKSLIAISKPGMPSTDGGEGVTPPPPDSGLGCSGSMAGS